MNRENLRKVIVALLKVKGSLTKLRISQYCLLVDILHYRMHGRSFTELFYVKRSKGIEVAFLYEALNDIIGLFKEEIVQTDLGEKVVYSLSEKDEEVSEELMALAKKVVENYPEEKLSIYVHNLPAVKYSKEYDVFYIEELAIEDEGEYWRYVDKMAEVEEEEEED